MFAVDSSSLYIIKGAIILCACYERWDLTSDTIQTDMTLYAGWQKLQ